MKLKEEVRSKTFIEKVGSGEISPDDLLSIFTLTTKKLLDNDFKSGCLIYADKPRELEMRQIMCEVLTHREINHMIECPIHSPTQKLENRTSFTDLSLFLNTGIIDIEFKKAPSDIKRDFPKLLSSNSIGCSSFYLFTGKSIEKQLPFIIDRYKEAYENTRVNLENKNMLKNKWYIFFLLSFEEKKVIQHFFKNIEELDFSDMTLKEQLV